MNGNSDVNPFVGPRPIQVGEQLFGRSAEVRELFNQLRARRIVVLHSPSGAGKSSLVQAGLIPKLKEGKFDVWRPIRVNLDPTAFDDLPPQTNRFLLSALVSLEDELPAAHRRSPAELAGMDFLEYLDTRPRRKGRAGHDAVLLFDQFEEILTTAPRAIEAKLEFFRAVGRALDSDKYWALFIVREDFLAALAPYRDLIPTRMLNTFRLDLLGLAGAREAAVGLAKSGGREFPAAEKLVSDLARVQVQHADGTFTVEQGIYVEPVYLQVVCRRLWDAMPADDPSIDEEDIAAYGEVSVSLGAYYADAVSTIAAGDVGKERAIRDWIGNKLIVAGIRSAVRQEAGASAGLDNAIIDQLLDCYVIRTEQRAGANWFELSHDRLVEPILADNEAWRQSHLHALQVQAKLWEEGGRAQALLLGADALTLARSWAADNPGLLTASEREFLDLSEERRRGEAQRRLIRRGFTLALAAAFVVAIVLGRAAAIAGDEAERQRSEADRQRQEAEDARAKAEEALAEAERAEASASRAKDSAEQAKVDAEKAQKESERAVRQMLGVALRRFVSNLSEQSSDVGQIELGEGWTPLIERGGQVLAAARIGQKSRMFVATHRAVLGDPKDREDALLLEITAQWLLGDQARRGIAILTQHGEASAPVVALQDKLRALGYEVEIDPPLDSLDALDAVGMLIVDDRWLAFSEAELATLAEFWRDGRGVLAIGAGHVWLGQPGVTLDDYPMNQLLRELGVRFSERTIALAALEQVEQPAKVRFENQSDKSVNAYVRDASGYDEYYTTLAAGEARELLTSRGREWVFRSPDGRTELGAASIKWAEQIVTIDEGVVGKPSQPVQRREPKPERPEGPGTSDPSESVTGNKLPETLTDADMAAAFSAAKQASRACGKQHDTVMPMVKVTLVVAPSGKVTSASALSPMSGTPEGTCAADAILGLQFPKSRRGVQTTWKLPL